MKILIKGKLHNILDSHLPQNSLRIKVHVICNLDKINDQYFVREKTLRNLYNYFREIGIKSVAQKILSRLRETIRNEKYVSVGVGRIVQSTSTSFLCDKIVCFVATNHPAQAERMVIHENFAFYVNSNNFFPLLDDRIVYFNSLDQEKWWKFFIAWSPYSGFSAPLFNEDTRKKIFSSLESAFTNKKKYILIDQSKISEIKNTHKKILSSSTGKTAALFGYGNYAKTMLIPNLNKCIKITHIHEIDPTQLLPLKKNICYDTSPYPRINSRQDIYFIAGYHHTHANIAISGLQAGIDVVVEKPLMTHRNDLEKLLDAIRKSQSELYVCFQRRYHCFNDYFFEDFKLKKGDPISYYAIIYEELLPKYHWYLWPNSRSAIISNGCHWVDHFLFLNNFSQVISFFSKKTLSGEIIISVELENSATLCLILSHLGSPRIGMQEYIELRSGKNTAKITNGNIYQSENRTRVIRRSKTSKYESYRKMYRLISQNIVDKDAPRLSDSWEHVNAASSLILSLDEQLT